MDGMLQTEIRVPFLQSNLWYQFQAFEAGFWEIELIWTNGKRDWPVLDFANHLPKSIFPKRQQTEKRPDWGETKYSAGLNLPIHNFETNKLKSVHPDVFPKNLTGMLVPYINHLILKIDPSTTTSISNNE